MLLAGLVLENDQKNPVSVVYASAYSTDKHFFNGDEISKK
jgi:hypothetical protein